MINYIAILLILAASSNPYANKSFYSKSGAYQGRTSSQGNVYNKNNVYKGNIRANGSIYNKANAYQGQIKSTK